MTKNKKYLVFALVTVILISGVWIYWNKTASTTRIALVNFQPFQTTSIIRANQDKNISYKEITTDELDKLGSYDFVIAFGMGLNLTAEEREQIQKLVDKGLPLHVYAPTSPENKISSLNDLEKIAIDGFLGNGNKRNYQSFARYVRKNIDKKKYFVTEPDSLVKSASDVLYHLDEDVAFSKVDEYENYLKSNGFFIENAPKVVITGGLNDPFSGNKDNVDSLIVSLQHSGLNVYPVSSFMKRFDFLKEIKPDAVVYFAHGRLAMGQGEAGVEWLKEQNIPIFAPLTILQTQEEWEKDPNGMMGGFISQSIVMPELDGAIYPYVLNAQVVDEDGLYLFKAIPERLDNFTQIVNNHISLKHKKNVDKKLAIYYFKGAGQSTLTAQGLETIPSLYNFLKRLQAEGYKIDNLPSTINEFEKLLMTQGAIMSPYAEGSFDEFLKTGKPELIEKSIYESWIRKSLPEGLYQDVTNAYGEAPGRYMAVQKEGQSYLSVARIELGNIVLLPQPMAGLGDDEFAIVHGTKSAPPHTYIASYLWTQYGFKADAMLHFGTHGSLEFTPSKQLALRNYDWPDRLVGNVPHFYYYTIGNIGESMMAKRRSYATTVSYLTPPFMETAMRSQFKDLQDAIQKYYKTEDEPTGLEIKKLVLKMGLHRDLRLDSIPTTSYSLEEVEKIENFAEEIANEKMTGQLYTSGESYSKDKIHSTVLAMSADPIAYSLANLDRLKGKVTEEQLKNKSYFTRTYLQPTQTLVNRILNGATVNEDLICSVANITKTELAYAKEVLTPKRSAMMQAMMATSPNSNKKPSDTKKSGSREEQEYTAEEKAQARAVVEIERTINNITSYKKALEESPTLEFNGLINALNGGYIVPSSGGDAVSNPNAVPTGRNLYAINAEATPTEAAWDKGITLVNATLEQYQKQHGTYPRKVSYTFWSSEFIETEGATLAQVLYMLGVEPVRDGFGRVSDLQLISPERLGRPRIDVVVQTSGQFRDLAASRLALINRAVEIAAASTNDKFDNYVSNSAVETERQLVEQGISPKEARELSTQRVFGGINGMYGTGIQEMVTSGDRWENENEIANTYIQNVGAIYDGNDNWGKYQAGLLRAVLHNTDVVVQPRQSNTWGALSLDHVYEFMGGMNLAVRNVTGKDPEAYFADYRNRNNVKMQELKEAIGIEARSTVFNPTYIKEVMKGNASSASQITEVVTNTYGWNVMKPTAIDNEMWDKFYEVYVKDEYNLGTENFFRNENPQALQEVTAVMLETARKGMWQATEQQLADIANLHTELVKDFGASGTGFAGNNTKLQDYIKQQVDQQQASDYQKQVDKMKNASVSSENVDNGMVLSKQETNLGEQGEKNNLNGILIISIVLVAFIILLFILRKKRKKQEEKDN
jgi:Cobalamin biosynthesis protein CobN and related Mg-chelatases